MKSRWILVVAFVTILTNERRKSKMGVHKQNRYSKAKYSVEKNQSAGKTNTPFIKTRQVDDYTLFGSPAIQYSKREKIIAKTLLTILVIAIMIGAICVLSRGR